MVSVARWWARLSAVVGALALAVFVPVTAWASSGPGEIVVEAARRRPRGSGFGYIGALCCLVVIAVIVLLIVLLTRRRGGPRR